MLAKLEGLEPLEAASLAQALELIATHDPELLLLDVRLSERAGDRGGLELLRAVREKGGRSAAVMITSSGELTDIREAMRLGARDYVLKDELCPEMLLPIVENLRDRAKLSQEVVSLRERVDRSFGTAGLLGTSSAMEALRRMVARLADSGSSVLISGDTGSGKEMVARALHHLSSRRDAPFLAVNCSALPGTLMESIIFGHERGAFTGAERRVRGHLELAGTGTLLLDEIAEMPLDLQAKLLRVLEERKFRPLGAEQDLPFRARVLAATHADLDERLAEGRFREDLFYRLNVVTIRVPPLAARGDDVVELALAFANETSRKLRFSEDAIRWFRAQPWRGNVRELRNVIDRLALLAESDVIDEATLRQLVAPRAGQEPQKLLSRIARDVLAMPDELGSRLRLVERALVEHAMSVAGDNKTTAARLLRINRKAFARRWDRLATDTEDDE